MSTAFKPKRNTMFKKKLFRPKLLISPVNELYSVHSLFSLTMLSLHEKLNNDFKQITLDVIHDPGKSNVCSVLLDFLADGIIRFPKGFK